VSGIEVINGVVHRYSELPWVYDDGGRADSGRRGLAGDCVARAVAIASGRPYDEVYRALAAGNAQERGKRSTGRRTAREGIHTGRSWFKDYMASLGFRWVPTMGIGTGCRVHLRQGELPGGRLVVTLSHHVVAVIDGVVHDTGDPSRGGTRCVYGYYLTGPCGV
jgi:hypothetical protein